MKSAARTALLFLSLILATNSPAGAQPAIGLEAGQQAPAFTAPTHDGGQISLAQLYQQGPVVLIFYRGAWCPYCNLHLQAFQSRIQDFKALGAQVVAVSVDKPEYAAEAAQKGNLDFPVVSNPGGEILADYNLMNRVPAELARKYREEYNIDLEKHSGREDHLIAVPATFVIDQNGIIVFAYANEDYKVRTQPEEVLAVLEKLVA